MIDSSKNRGASETRRVLNRCLKSFEPEIWLMVWTMAFVIMIAIYLGYRPTQNNAAVEKSPLALKNLGWGISTSVENLDRWMVNANRRKGNTINERLP